MHLTQMPPSAFPRGSSGAGMALDVIWHLGKGAGFYTTPPANHCRRLSLGEGMASAQGQFLEMGSADSSSLPPS